MTILELKFDKKIYSTKVRPLWCPGCGDFAMFKALKEALYELQLDPKQTILVAGIGCSSKMSDAVGVYGLHNIHGRAIPSATGIKMANHNLNVIVYGGDGDMLGIGGNHFTHACRRNMDLTLIIPNNHTYGLTTGQTSPTSDIGYKTKTSPKGSFDRPVNPVFAAISAGATFVAKVSSADNKHMGKVMTAAIAHKGMSVVVIDQFCITWNRINTPDYYADKYFDVQETDHDLSNFEDSLLLANMTGDRIPFGIIYHTEKVKSFEENYSQLQGKSNVERRSRQLIDVSDMLDSYI